MAQRILTHSSQEEAQDWRREFSQLVTQLDELAALLDLDLTQLHSQVVLDRSFPLRVSHSFVSRMQPRNFNDPLLMQVLPLKREHEQIARFTHDPLEEAQYRPMPGVIHKYERRLLLVLGGLCAIHCRYCFRRHFPYSEQQLSLQKLPEVLAYVEGHPQVNELIFSGGDPLSLPIAKLREVTDALADLPQITRLRVHTRLPIMMPACIDDAFISWTRSLCKPLVMVLHVNHMQEIDRHVCQAVSRLQAEGIQLLNQSVLLKGINDQIDTLVALSEGLFDLGVMPYYLHQLDPVTGAAHFEVTLDRAKAILFGMSRLLPGYLVPKLVTDIPGHPFKATHAAQMERIE